MRGRQTERRPNIQQAGTTPAHAGKTLRGSVRRLARRDHPRACGEDSWKLTALPTATGPPPLMRGRRRRADRCLRGPGTTPAHAGKTCTSRTGSGSGRDHPRACGEDNADDPAQVNAMGPPPRMRGRRRCSWLFLVRCGTTPAHAGKTLVSAFHARSGSDHPRACGEDSMVSMSSAMSRGPPPRMRGRLVPDGASVLREGTTPAHAGKT